ncbi:hypothetical protein GA0115259_108725, partial [Streptomyces sp. MnatMP-M17]
PAGIGYGSIGGIPAMTFLSCMECVESL